MPKIYKDVAGAEEFIVCRVSEGNILLMCEWLRLNKATVSPKAHPYPGQFWEGFIRGATQTIGRLPLRLIFDMHLNFKGVYQERSFNSRFKFLREWNDEGRP